ncbi:hypothetical protein PVK06_011603 [Gossypium arboreum]|uniref:Uncharacterized protein n=1 Tax=Gossypium arboreum TaxID=29729 RepID=A0ABR0Q9L4_GOSAR|nr:hypothetical protein PVK06_011603 [Gossypium arboreum]
MALVKMLVALRPPKTKLELERICKLNLKMREENEEICKKIDGLTSQLGAAKVKNDELSQEVAVEKERKEVLDIDMKKMAEEHKAIVNQIVEEHKAGMASEVNEDSVEAKVASTDGNDNSKAAGT